MIEGTDTVFPSCIKINYYRNDFKILAVYGKIDYEDYQPQP